MAQWVETAAGGQLVKDICLFNFWVGERTIV